VRIEGALVVCCTRMLGGASAEHQAVAPSLPISDNPTLAPSSWALSFAMRFVKNATAVDSEHLFRAATRKPRRGPL